MGLLAIQMESKTKSTTRATTDDKKTHETKAFIGSRLTEHFTIQKLSREIGVNDSILKKEFKRVFGKTILE